MIEGLVISKVLDLSQTEDRQALERAATPIPELAVLIQRFLTRYLELFPDPPWRTVYSGGLIAIPETPRHGQGFDLKHMLEMTGTLERLRGCQPVLQERARWSR